MSKLEGEHQRWVAGCAILFFLLAWEIASATAVGPANANAVVPPPSAVVRAFVREAQFLLVHGGITALEAIVGLGVALAGAFATATAFALSSLARQSLMPVVLASQTVPLVAIAPVLAGVIGDGMAATIVVTAWLCWFPAVIAFTHGFLKVHPDRLAIFTLGRATRWQTFRQLRLPGGAASIVAGVRASAGFGLIGAIVAEYSGANSGLGALIMQHVRGQHILPPDTLFAVVVFASVLGICVTALAYRTARYSTSRYLTDDA